MILNELLAIIKGSKVLPETLSELQTSILINLFAVGPSKGGIPERLINFLPFVCFGCSFITFVPYALGPDSPQTVYSGMTTYFQNSPMLMIITMVYEYLTFSFIMCSFNYSCFLQVGILQSTQRELGGRLKELR